MSVEKTLEKPLPPAEGMCCDSACSPCVWDTFYEKRREWKLAQAQLIEQQKQKSDD